MPRTIRLLLLTLGDLLRFLGAAAILAGAIALGLSLGG